MCDEDYTNITDDTSPDVHFQIPIPSVIIFISNIKMYMA